MGGEGGSFVHVKVWRPPKVYLPHTSKWQAWHLATGLGFKDVPPPSFHTTACPSYGGIYELLVRRRNKCHVCSTELLETCNRFVITNTVLSGTVSVLHKSRSFLQRQYVKWASDHWQQDYGVSTALSNLPAGSTNYKARATIVILYSNYLHDKGHHISLNSHLASALQN